MIKMLRAKHLVTNYRIHSLPDFLLFMNIVIAGGAGFVGTNLLRAWVKKNPKYSFLILDNYIKDSNLDIGISDFRFISGAVNFYDWLSKELKLSINYLLRVYSG